MGHRIQFVLTDEQYEVFQQEVKASGMSISQLCGKQGTPPKNGFRRNMGGIFRKTQSISSGHRF